MKTKSTFWEFFILLIKPHCLTLIWISETQGLSIELCLEANISQSQAKWEHVMEPAILLDLINLKFYLTHLKLFYCSFKLAMIYLNARVAFFLWI